MHDELMERFRKLSQNTTMPDAFEIAENWLLLAIDFYQAERPAMGAACLNRSNAYRVISNVPNIPQEAESGNL